MVKQLDTSTYSLSYQVIGEGKPVMLVHGFGEDSSVWSNQIDHLKDHCKLLIPDLPGSGQSAISNGHPDSYREAIGNWTIEKFADCLFAIFEEENITKCVLIGHSMGGYITLAFAEKYMDRLDGFGLFHSSAYPDSEEKKTVRRKGIEFIRQNGAFAFLKTTTPNLFSPESRDQMAELIDEHIAGLNNFLPENLVTYYEAMMARPDRTDTLRKSPVPVLFIMGKYDSAVPVEDSLKQCHLPENAYIHILRHSAHMGMLEEPELCNMALEEYLL